MKQFALFCAVSASASSFASFELALVLQTYTPSNGPNSLHITRWDPANRVSLGQFTVFDNSTTANLAFNTSAPGTVDLIQSQFNTLVARRYNYSTGLFVSEYSTGVAMNSLSSGRYVSSNLLVAGNFGGTHQARLYSQGGGLVRAYTTPGGTTLAVDAITVSSGVTFVLTRQAGTVSGNKYTLTSHAAGSGAIVQSVVVADNTSETLHSLVATGNAIAVGSAYFADRRIVPYTGTTMSSAFAVGGYVTETATLTQGHGDYIWGIGIDSVNTRMYFTTARIANFSGNYWSTSSTNYGTIIDSAMVLAPEPGTFLAIGVGVAALLKRRRKSR